jgi:hypothetical protein
LHPSEPAQALQPYCSAQRVDPDDMVTVLSSDIEEALELLSLSLGHGVLL